ncbi:hypothetical protein, partial [Cyanobium sp. ATX 6A2]|uniref:hypothetical protein n=1 Tax=Cyanobium sp. ATX 6A2 TaxID=2823700 RepID=UPI0020CD3D2F
MLTKVSAKSYAFYMRSFAALLLNWGLLKKGSAGWIQILRTSGALSAQTLGYTAANESAISSFQMF